MTTVSTISIYDVQTAVIISKVSPLDLFRLRIRLIIELSCKSNFADLDNWSFD